MRAAALSQDGRPYRFWYLLPDCFDDENGAQVRDFVIRTPGFSVEKPADVPETLGERAWLFPPGSALFRAKAC